MTPRRNKTTKTVHSGQSRLASRVPLGRSVRDDTGAVAVEIALGVPISVLVIFLIVAAFHLGRATIDVNSAANPDYHQTFVTDKCMNDGDTLDLTKYNGDASWTLPMPARFVIDRRGIIRSAESDPDYTTRPEPSDTLDALQALR